MAENAQVALVKYVESELVKRADNLADILPNNMSPARFTRVTTQAIFGNPSLIECSRASIVMAVLEAAQLGLEPTGSLSRAWLVPYRDKKRGGVKVARLQIGWMGYCDLARNSGKVKTITAEVVYDDDEFAYQKGTDPFIRHIPALADVRDPNKITYAYAVITYTNGGVEFEVMSRSQIEAVRARSNAANNGPWITDYPQMCRKTPLRRLVQRSPLSPELQQAIERDIEVEVGSTGQPAGGQSSVLKASLRSKLARPVGAQEAPGAAIEGEVVSDSAAETSPVQEQTEPVQDNDGWGDLDTLIEETRANGQADAEDEAPRGAQDAPTGDDVMGAAGGAPHPQPDRPRERPARGRARHRSDPPPLGDMALPLGSSDGPGDDRR
jgi:recombination protein RecT